MTSVVGDMEIDHQQQVQQPTPLQSLKAHTEDKTTSPSQQHGFVTSETLAQAMYDEEEPVDEPAGDALSADPAHAIPTGYPTCLHTEGYSYGVRILHDRLSVQYVQKAMHLLDVGTVRSNRPIPKARLTPIWYFECQIVSTGEKNQITIGLAPMQSSCLFAPSNMHALDTPVPAQASLRQHDTASLTCKQVGMDNLSYGYRGDEGKKFHGPPLVQGRPGLGGASYGPSFAAGDVIGCGVNYYTGCVFFTRNGAHMGDAFRLDVADWMKVDGKECRDPLGTPIDARLDLFAAVSLHSKGEHVQLNFGQRPFAFDVKALEATEKGRVQRQIAGQQLDSAIMLPLIRSYMLSQGYTKSLAALQRISQGDTTQPADDAQPVEMEDAEMKDVPAASSSSSAAAGSAAIAASGTPAAAAAPSTHDRIAGATQSQRRAIRDAIESGEVDVAFQAIESLVPGLFRRVDLRQMIPPPCDLRLVELRLRSLQFIRILADDRAPTRIVDAITFAQEHFAPFQQPPAAHDAPAAAAVTHFVASLMSLLAYPTVSSSPLAYLAEDAYRLQVSNEVNSALLAGLCTPADATPKSIVHGMSSLEILLRQTCAVEQTIQQQGYPLALPSVRDTWQE